VNSSQIELTLSQLSTYCELAIKAHFQIALRPKNIPVLSEIMRACLKVALLNILVTVKFSKLYLLTLLTLH